MNCRQARSLFSARLDGELTDREDHELTHHLQECAKGCRERWASFQTAVRLVRALPAVEPDSAFVGQVLDRVRAYEAGVARGRVPVPRAGLRTRLRLGLAGARLRVQDFLDEFPGLVPVPVRFAGVGAVGLAAGFLLASGVGWNPFTDGSSGSVAVTTSSGTAISDSRDPVDPGSQPVVKPGPFGDLVDEIPPAEPAAGSGELTTPDTIFDYRPDLATPGGGPVRVVRGDAQPPTITF